MILSTSSSSSCLRASFDEDGDDRSVSSVGGLPPLPSQQQLRTVVSMEKNDGSSSSKTLSSGNVEKIDEGEKTSSYPINLPSPILLASSMILAISSTGSLYELAGGGTTTSKLGLLPTLLLGGMGLPTSVFLIYAAIRKGAAETEEDDKEYNRQNARKRL